MPKYLTGSFISADGATHSNAVAIVRKFNVDTLDAVATVDVQRFHSLANMAAKNPIYPPVYYQFMRNPQPGQHDYDAVFIPNQNQSLNLFNYLKALPEWEGWEEGMA